MERVFRAQKMLDRVKKEGKENLLDQQTIDFIWSLDGEIGNDYNWESFVNGNDMVWIPANDKHDGTYVALCDCEYPSDSEAH